MHAIPYYQTYLKVLYLVARALSIKLSYIWSFYNVLTCAYALDLVLFVLSALFLKIGCISNFFNISTCTHTLDLVLPITKQKGHTN